MNELKRQMCTLAEWQRNLLPHTLAQPEGWRIVGHHEPGKWPGGDYYDVLPLPDGRLLFLLADASDQGAPAAALVAMVRVTVHSCPLGSGFDRLPFCPLHNMVTQPPHIILGHLNHVLHENSLEEQFVTAFCGILDPVDGNFHFANAGHPAPRWWHADTRQIEALRDPAGLPLGLDRRATYHHKRVVIEPGDLVVLYSDSLTALQNAEGIAYGCKLLDDVITTTATQGAEAVKSALQVTMNDFLNEASLNDDVTLLIFERLE